jgi:hypothetical protein
MFRKHNLLTAGLMVLVSVSGQSFAIAGGHHGGSGGGSFQGGKMSGNGARPSFNVQPSFHKNVMSQPNNTFKTQQFQNNPLNSLQVNKVNNGALGNTHVMKDPKLVLNQPKLGTLNTQLLNHSNQSLKTVKLPDHFDLGKAKPINGIKPIIPINPGKPFPPICPPQGGQCGTGGCWKGGCWGNGCGFNWNVGCGNWTFGNCGCGYWPGYFGCGYPYPSYPVYTPTYFTTMPIVEVIPTSTTIVLNEPAVPPSPSATQATTRDIDLAVKEVHVVEGATATRGALYRITIINKGPTNLDVATRVAALGIKDNRPTDDTPRAIETLKGLNVGESTNVDVRMPVAANDLPKLLVAVEIPDMFKDTDESNNVAAGEVAQLPQLASAK